MVTSFEENPVGRAGNLIHGVRLMLDVLTERQQGLTTSIVLFRPRVDYLYAPERTRLEELIRAAGLDQVFAAFPPTSGSADNWDSLTWWLRRNIESSQFVVDLERCGEYLRAVRFRHVDDPSVSRWVLNDDELMRVPIPCRRSPHSFQTSSTGDDVVYEPPSADDYLPDPADYEPYDDEEDDDVEYGP
jgi:hypothetical protein